MRSHNDSSSVATAVDKQTKVRNFSAFQFLRKERHWVAELTDGRLTKVTGASLTASSVQLEATQNSWELVQVQL